MIRPVVLGTAILALFQTASAHASIRKPKPILFDEKRDTYNAPLAPDFSNFPCKGYHNQPFSSAESWVAGQEASFVIDTSHIAAHGGGSCQASISHDGGKTFEVLHSFIGDCPRGANGNDLTGEQEFKFMIPANEPAGEAIFAWTWFAAIANREMYMNCAFVTIENSNANAAPTSPRPMMFVGFLQAGVCNVGEQTNLDFPEPGTFVTDGSQNPTAQFKGKTKPKGSGCGSAESGGGEPILNSLPPNAGAIGSTKPAPNPNPNPAPVDSSASAPATTAPAATNMPVDPSKIMVTVTATVTNAVTDVVYVTSTTYQRAIIIVEPTGSAKAKRDDANPNGPRSIPEGPSSLTARDSDGSCDFKASLKVGGECPVPSTKSSQWKDCVWKKFCSCLDENLRTSDIVNFVQVKAHCDCLDKGIGCPVAARNRHKRRHLIAKDLILPERSVEQEGGKRMRLFKA